MTARPALEIRKASPHELVVVAACALSGAYSLIDSRAESQVLADAFARWALIAFNIVFVLGSVLIIAGYLATERSFRGRGDLADGLQIEQVGLGVSAPLLVSYATAVFIASGLHGLLSALVTLGIAIAHVLRMRRINADLKAWNRAVRDPVAADPPPLGIADPSGEVPGGEA